MPFAFLQAHPAHDFLFSLPSNMPRKKPQNSLCEEEMLFPSLTLTVIAIFTSSFGKPGSDEPVSVVTTEIAEK